MFYGALEFRMKSLDCGRGRARLSLVWRSIAVEIVMLLLL